MEGVVGLKSEDGGRRTDDGGRRTDDGGQMTVSERISSFRDLRVYQLAFFVQQEIFELSKGFPKEEKYSLTDHEWNRFNRLVVCLAA